MVVEWIVANKELLKMLYALAILSICSFIVIKADRLFKISDYQGIRYFRNDFFFVALSIVVRFILSPIETTSPVVYSMTMDFLFRFFSIVAASLLAHSLIWKKLGKKRKYHSLLNLSALVLYLVAFVVSYLSLIFKLPLIFYLFQILILLVILFISLKNWFISGKEYPFLLTYSVAIFIWLLAWLIEGMKIFLAENNFIQIIIYGLNILFFLLFLIGVRSLSNEREEKR